MKNFWTWKKVVLFLGIIGLGILGLVIADQYDFMGGRSADGETAVIGNGVPDPLIGDNIPKELQDKPRIVPTANKASVSESSGIDGVKCGNKKC